MAAQTPSDNMDATSSLLKFIMFLLPVRRISPGNQAVDGDRRHKAAYCHYRPDSWANSKTGRFASSTPTVSALLKNSGNV
jgi:hypothetical protein